SPKPRHVHEPERTLPRALPRTSNRLAEPPADEAPGRRTRARESLVPLRRTGGVQPRHATGDLGRLRRTSEANPPPALRDAIDIYPLPPGEGRFLGTRRG